MNEENKLPQNDYNHEKFLFMTFRKKLENNDEDQSSITPKRPLLARDRAYIDVSPLSDHNSRFEQPKYIPVPTTPVCPIKHDQSTISTAESCMFNISHQTSSRSTVIDEDDDDTCIPVYVHRKARPAPSTTWKAPIPLQKSSTTLRINNESSAPLPELPLTQAALIISFQPAIRARIPFNLSSTNTIDKQIHTYTIWLNTLFTPFEFLCNTTINQSLSNEVTITKSLRSLAESNRWYALRDRAREIFTRDIQSIAGKIRADTDIDHCRINPKSDLNFSARAVSRQALLHFISSYNRIWFRLAMEVLFPINIENYLQMKLAIDQYLFQSNANTSSPLNESNVKKTNLNNTKTASVQIRLTIKNLIIIIIFLERAKLLRLIDNDPCLYVRESKFKSTKESIDVLSRDFISSDTNLLRRLKLAGYEPIYRQTSLDEYNYLITNNENKLFEDLKDGIRLTRCAQILLSSTNEHVARFDLSAKLKCPVVNLVHKLLNIDQAFELLQTYGHVNLTGISNKDIMNGNKQRTLELLWRIFIVCYLPKYLSPIDNLNDEISILTKNLSKFSCRSVEQQLITIDIIPLQKQHIDFTPIIHLLIKWVQLICAHYKFWLYDLQESFADGRAFLFIISYYLPSLCDYTRDIKHLTTLATCQTRDEHIQFNFELNQPQLPTIYEKNVKSNFRFLEECIKQFGTFSSDLIKYEHYAKDVPDERCTIIILAMLAHDLLFSTNNQNTNEMDFRHQQLFEELREKYSNDYDETKKEEIIINEQEIEIIRENSIDFSELSLSNEIPIEEIITLKLSISSSTMNYPIEDTYPIPIIQSESMQSSFVEEEEEDMTKVTNISSLSSVNSDRTSTSILDTMNYDILDRLELLCELNDDDGDEDSFNSARSGLTTMMDHRRISITETMATISLDDFVELEKTIENEEIRNNADNTSLSLIDETTSSDVDSIEMNKLDEASFVDVINTKIIKETLTLFLAHHQQQISENEETIGHNNQSIGQTQITVKSEAEREIHAAKVVQAHWRGHQVRVENERNDHPVVTILRKLRLYDKTNSTSLTLRERMLQIIKEYSESSSCSLTTYLHFLRDIEPIVICCFEIRHLIAEQGLLRLFFILMKCCNRSGPSTVLLSKVLNILQLFTVKHSLIMKLIDKQEQIKDFIMLLLKNYQKNSWELFEHICFLLQAIVKDEEARKILQSNKSFTDAIEYIYKRIFNKVKIEDEKYRQQVRSTPKRSTGSKTRRVTLLNQSSILHQTPKGLRQSGIQNENILKKNLVSIEQFMEMFYRD